MINWDKITKINENINNVIYGDGEKLNEYEISVINANLERMERDSSQIASLLKIIGKKFDF